MYIKLFSITEAGETIECFGHECKIVNTRYLFSVRQENVIGINQSELKSKIEGCYDFGYVDIKNKCKLLELNNASELSRANIFKKYYEVFLNEDAKKLFPDVQRYYTDHDCYYKLLKTI